jgi:hypothetical protein
MSLRHVQDTELGGLVVGLVVLRPAGVSSPGCCAPQRRARIATLAWGHHVITSTHGVSSHLLCTLAFLLLYGMLDCTRRSRPPRRSRVL